MQLSEEDRLDIEHRLDICGFGVRPTADLPRQSEVRMEAADALQDGEPGSTGPPPRDCSPLTSAPRCPARRNGPARNVVHVSREEEGRPSV